MWYFVQMSLVKAQGESEADRKRRLQNLAERLEKLLKERKLSNSELARRSGITRETIGQMLKARFDPRLETIVQLAKFLEVSPSYLAFGDEH